MKHHCLRFFVPRFSQSLRKYNSAFNSSKFNLNLPCLPWIYIHDLRFCFDKCSNENCTVDELWDIS